MAEEGRQEEEDFPALLEPARPKGPSASSSGGVGMGQPAPSAWSSSRAEDLRRGLAEAMREEEEEEQRRRRRREGGGASLPPGGLVSGSRVSLLTPLTRDFLRAPPVQPEPVAPPPVPNSDAADGPVAGGGGVGGGEGRGAGVAVSQGKARAGVASPAGSSSSSSHKCNERLRARMRDEWAQRLLDSKRAALEERLMRLEDERGARMRELWCGITTPDGRPRGGSVGSGDEQEEEGKGERERKGGARRAGEEATTKGWFEFLRPSGSVREPLVAKEVAMRPTKQLAAQVQEGEEEEVKGAADDFEVLEAVVRAGGKTVKDLQAVLARAYWDAREAQTRRNAFHVAAAEGRADLLEGLVAYAPQGVDSLDRRRMTPLLCAAEAGHTECVKLLLKRGAKADVRDRAGETGG